MVTRVRFSAVRSLLAVLAAAMLVLPAHAGHCASCLVGHGECRHSDEGKPKDAPPAGATCCQAPQASETTFATGSACSEDSGEPASCFCCQPRQDHTGPGGRLVVELDPSPFGLAPAEHVIGADVFAFQAAIDGGWLASPSPFTTARGKPVQNPAVAVP